MCVLPEAVCSGEEDRGRPSLKRGGQVFLQSRIYNSCAALLEPSDKLSRIAGDRHSESTTPEWAFLHLAFLYAHKCVHK